MQAGLCTDSKRRIDHVSSVTSYPTRHNKQRDIRTQWRTSNVSWSVFWLCSCLWQQEDKLCLRKGCRQWGKILHCQKKPREFGKMQLQSFKAFEHWVLCREVLTNQRTATFLSLGSVGLHNYWNVIEIAIWPSAISKSQELQFFDEGQMFDNILMNYRSAVSDGLAYRSCSPDVRNYYCSMETPTNVTLSWF